MSNLHGLVKFISSPYTLHTLARPKFASATLPLPPPFLHRRGPDPRRCPLAAATGHRRWCFVYDGGAAGGARGESHRGGGGRKGTRSGGTTTTSPAPSTTLVIALRRRCWSSGTESFVCALSQVWTFFIFVFFFVLSVNLVVFG